MLTGLQLTFDFLNTLRVFQLMAYGNLQSVQIKQRCLLRLLYDSGIVHLILTKD
jgi:hypothetical protein